MKGSKLMDEYQFESLLNIKTSGEQKKFNESLHYNRYEPTSYLALETLFKEYELNNSDNIVDFGCGKGRLNFFIDYFYNIKVTGIEMNKYFYEEALDNKRSYLKKYKKDPNNIQFINCFAQEYEINPCDNIFYFFNPFSLQIFMKIIDNILSSLENSHRTVHIVLYYPSDDYIYFLENMTAFNLVKEIKIPVLHIKDSRQLFSIYDISF